MIRLAILFCFLPTFAHGGTAPEADLTTPIPICEEMAQALDLPEEAFAGLHPDAFAQFQAMVADLCQPPDDARSWAILRAWGEGPDVPPAPVPLPSPITALALGLAGLGLVKGTRRCPTKERRLATENGTSGRLTASRRL